LPRKLQLDPINPAAQLINYSNTPLGQARTKKKNSAHSNSTPTEFLILNFFLWVFSAGWRMVQKIFAF
jgi:hypothetical protein